MRIANNKNIQTMEQKDIDIYEILKDEEYGTELYTPKCGKVWHSGMANDKDSAKAIWTEDKDGREHFFDKNGKIYKEGEVLLFPSNEMRDWSKFFKKGDVLICYEGKKPYYTIFDGFEDNTYRAFKGKFAYDCYKDKWYQNRVNLSTNTFQKLNRSDSEIYVTKIEERFGGKLNRETLEIEKPQPEFKDGDIAFSDYGNRQNVFIVSDKTALSEGYNSFISLDLNSLTLSMGYRTTFFKKDLCELRLATEAEKQQLFDALEKEGKAWDSEKKQIVDLKPAFELGKLYVFDEEDEDGKVTVIGKLIGKEEGELTIGNQYEIENENFVTNETFFLNISLHKELREATENEVELFNKHCAIWEKKEKEAMAQPDFKPFDKVLVRNGKKCKWLPAFFILDRGEEMAWRYSVLPLRSGKTADFIHCIPYEGHENIAFTSYDIEDLPF